MSDKFFYKGLQDAPARDRSPGGTSFQLVVCAIAQSQNFSNGIGLANR